MIAPPSSQIPGKIAFLLLGMQLMASGQRPSLSPSASTLPAAQTIKANFSMAQQKGAIFRAIAGRRLPAAVAIWEGTACLEIPSPAARLGVARMMNILSTHGLQPQASQVALAQAVMESARRENNLLAKNADLIQGGGLALFAVQSFTTTNIHWGYSLGLLVGGQVIKKLGEISAREEALIRRDLTSYGTWFWQLPHTADATGCWGPFLFLGPFGRGVPTTKTFEDHLPLY